jgi:hypothetical protein
VEGGSVDRECTCLDTKTIRRVLIFCIGFWVVFVIVVCGCSVLCPPVGSHFFWGFVVP